MRDSFRWVAVKLPIDNRLFPEASPPRYQSSLARLNSGRGVERWAEHWVSSSISVTSKNINFTACRIHYPGIWLTEQTFQSRLVQSSFFCRITELADSGRLKAQTLPKYLRSAFRMSVLGEKNRVQGKLSHIPSEEFRSKSMIAILLSAERSIVCPPIHHPAAIKINIKTARLSVP